MKQGYALDTSKNATYLSKPQTPKKISLSPERPVYVVVGTSTKVMEWIIQHPEIVCEYKHSFHTARNPPSEDSIFFDFRDEESSGENAGVWKLLHRRTVRLEIRSSNELFDLLATQPKRYTFDNGVTLREVRVTLEADGMMDSNPVLAEPPPYSKAVQRKTSWQDLLRIRSNRE